MKTVKLTDLLSGNGQSVPSIAQPTNILTVQTANEWIRQASQRPIPNKLFYEFWYEGEVCILFASTNVGKSILAVQIADQISRGDYGLSPQKVLYGDFELSDKQFEGRYSEKYQNHYQFSDNFYRAQIDRDKLDVMGSFEDLIIQSLETSIKETGTRVVIVDNLTYLGTETEKAKTAGPLMKRLNMLKGKYDLSLLVLAHTPKRDASRPLTRNDLQGSSMLMHFCDSSFAIGESTRDNSSRYLKQIKVRNGGFTYDGDNVMVHTIEKLSNCVRFAFAGFTSERDHLKAVSDQEAAEIDAQILELAKQGIAHREIARQLGTNHKKVGRVIKRNAGADGTPGTPAPPVPPVPPAETASPADDSGDPPF